MYKERPIGELPVGTEFCFTEARNMAFRIGGGRTLTGMPVAIEQDIGDGRWKTAYPQESNRRVIPIKYPYLSMPEV